LNNRVRELREAAGLTQASLAQLTGVSRQTINAIETGKYDPSIWLAYAISKTFGRRIEDIFIFEEAAKDGEEQ
jgi:putative transcriptional regulator